MSEEEILKRFLIRISETKDLEYKRSLLYSAYTLFLLSKVFFKLNIDIKSYLTPLLIKLDPLFENRKKTLVFKDYVYKSRSLIIARFIRIIQLANDDAISLLTSSLSSFLNVNNEKKHKSQKNAKKKRENSVDMLLKRFGRS